MATFRIVLAVEVPEVVAELDLVWKQVLEQAMQDACVGPLSLLSSLTFVSCEQTS